jgi:hypothetical protein
MNSTLTKKDCEREFAALPLREQRAIMALIQELYLAREKHPTWPQDLIHCAAIIGEEAGELLQASLNHTYENEPVGFLEIEAIQTGATVLRFLTERCKINNVEFQS